MSVLSRSIPMFALALGLGASALSAQDYRTDDFQWYLGGQGGILNYRSPAQTRGSIPMVGANIMIIAKRTGLLLSAEHAFKDDQPGFYNFATSDGDSGPVNYTYQGIRRYSAILLAFPWKGSPMRPYFGIGGGLAHATNLSVDDELASATSSTGFGSLLAGLELHASRFTIFGQYQVSTGGSLKTTSIDLGEDAFISGTGQLTAGPTHSFTAGLRFGLGNAKEGL
jgi:hypothetical protein